VRPFSAQRGCERERERKPFRPQNPNLRAIGTLHPPRVVTKRVAPVKRPDNVGSRYNTYFSGYLLGFASRGSVSFSRVFISTPRDNMPPVDSQEGSCFSCLYSSFVIVATPQSEIPRSIDDLLARDDKAAYTSITATTGITIIEESTRRISLHIKLWKFDHLNL